MKTFLTVLAIAAFAAAELDLEAPVNHEDVINAVNSRDTTWLAGPNERFEGAKLRDVQKLLGARMDQEALDYHRSLPQARPLLGVRIPDSFDSREHWANCSSVIGHIRDQANCGSCWAFGTTEAFNDRLCIKTGGTFTTLLSAQDTASCCNSWNGCFGSDGCNGGMPGQAWSYFVNTGIVTGGGYDQVGTGETCWPYQLPKCAHHVKSPKYPPCPETTNLPSCPNPGKCSESGYSKTWDQDIHKASSSYSVGASVQAIQQEIMTYGPVSGAFSVYSDFPTYQKGVYKHTTGSYLGGHAIKILGWGVENGTPYWLVANSWNDSWGDQGYFKILRGSDECGIESQVTAGHA